MRLGPTRIKYGGHTTVWDSWQLRFITGGLTIDPNTVPKRNRETGALDPNGFRIIYEGDVLGRITASGLWGPYDSSATDGRQVARVLAAGTYNLDSGYYESTIPENVNGLTMGGVDMGRILRRAMNTQYTDAEITTISQQLIANGALITFVESRGTPGYNVISVTLSPAALALTVGETAVINPTWEPANAANRHGDFSSSAPAIATVATANTISGAVGTITAVAAGTATITFRALDGGVTANMTVTVS
jgi:hypothetical protein